MDDETRACQLEQDKKVLAAWSACEMINEVIVLSDNSSYVIKPGQWAEVACDDADPPNTRFAFIVAIGRVDMTGGPRSFRIFVAEARKCSTARAAADRTSKALIPKDIYGDDDQVVQKSVRMINLTGIIHVLENPVRDGVMVLEFDLFEGEETEPIKLYSNVWLNPITSKIERGMIDVALPHPPMTEKSSPRAYLDLYIPSSVVRTVAKINSCPDDERAAGLPTRSWLHDNCDDVVVGQHYTVRMPNDLRNHTGNERLFSQHMWSWLLCWGGMPAAPGKRQGRLEYEGKYKALLTSGKHT